jgi:hypothetical protein
MENPLISGIRTAILPKIGNDLARPQPAPAQPILYPTGHQPSTPVQQHAEQTDLRGRPPP